MHIVRVREIDPVVIRGIMEEDKSIEEIKEEMQPQTVQTPQAPQVAQLQQSPQPAAPVETNPQSQS